MAETDEKDMVKVKNTNAWKIIIKALYDKTPPPTDNEPAFSPEALKANEEATKAVLDEKEKKKK